MAGGRPLVWKARNCPQAANDEEFASFRKATCSAKSALPLRGLCGRLYRLETVNQVLRKGSCARKTTLHTCRGISSGASQQYVAEKGYTTQGYLNSEGCRNICVCMFLHTGEKPWRRWGASLVLERPFRRALRQVHLYLQLYLRVIEVAEIRSFGFRAVWIFGTCCLSDCWGWFVSGFPRGAKRGRRKFRFGRMHLVRHGHRA